MVDTHKPYCYNIKLKVIFDLIGLAISARDFSDFNPIPILKLSNPKYHLINIRRNKLHVCLYINFSNII